MVALSASVSFDGGNTFVMLILVAVVPLPIADTRRRVNREDIVKKREAVGALVGATAADCFDFEYCRFKTKTLDFQTHCLNSILDHFNLII